MNVLVLHPDDRAPEVLTYDGLDAAIRGVLGGITVMVPIPLAVRERLACLTGLSGFALFDGGGLPVNAEATKLLGDELSWGDFLTGPFVMAASEPDSDPVNWVDVPEEVIMSIQARYEARQSDRKAQPFEAAGGAYVDESEPAAAIKRAPQAAGGRRGADDHGPLFDEREAAEVRAPDEILARVPGAAIQALLDPNRAIALRERELGIVPAVPGLYAIWIVDSSALRAAGIDGPAPKLLYVGKAEPRRSGLRGRLYRHVGAEWFDLSELLAVRGQLLFPWWAKAWPEEGAHVLKARTPLAELCERQALDWQNKFLRYTWSELDIRGRDLLAVEASVIRRHEPLLNRQHLPRFPPPTLREATRYKPARARWLWHTSWTGILPLMPDDRWEAWEGADNTDQRYGTDELGYPSSRAEAHKVWDADTVDWFPQEEISRLMRHCARGAPESTRIAVAATTDLDELELWWAAHAAAPTMGATVEDALAASLSCASEREYPAPASLPSEARIKQLLTVTAQSFMAWAH
jgi:hypothetical protein